MNTKIGLKPGSAMVEHRELLFSDDEDLCLPVLYWVMFSPATTKSVFCCGTGMVPPAFREAL
jgi:hypothetical protein